jgi:hypothetical protein
MCFDEREQFVLTGYQDKTKSKEAKDATQTVIARYGYTPDFVDVKTQAGAVLSSLGLPLSSPSTTEKSRHHRGNGSNPNFNPSYL